MSGQVGVAKPDPRIYDLAILRCGLVPSRTIFADDNAANVDAGRAAGFTALRFESPARLRADLEVLGLL